MKALVDAQKCTVCGVCQDVCPVSAITVTEIAAEISDDCTLCGMCVDTCEFGAISLPEVGTGPSDDLASYRGVWVFAEWRQGQVHRVAHELLGTGRKLADKLGVELAAVLLGHRLDGHVEELIAHGADVVYLADRPELARYTDEAYAGVLYELISRKRPEILLAGATSMGRSFIPRVAALARTGLTADCTDLQIGSYTDPKSKKVYDKLLMQIRPAFGGNIIATIINYDRWPQMATVREGVMPLKPADASRKGQAVTEKIAFEDADFALRIIERHREPRKVNLKGARTIVAGGGGVGSRANFKVVHDLAGAMGAAVGASAFQAASLSSFGGLAGGALALRSATRAFQALYSDMDMGPMSLGVLPGGACRQST